jgi:hypothetical protein
LLVIVLPVMWVTVLITSLISRGNQNGNSHDRQYNDQQEKFEDIKGVIRTVTRPLISSSFSCLSLYCLSCELLLWLPLWYLQTFLVGHCIVCHVHMTGNTMTNKKSLMISKG